MKRSDRLAVALVLTALLSGLVPPSVENPESGGAGAVVAGTAMGNPPSPRLVVQQFLPIRDSFVDRAFPDRNYGAGAGIVVGGNPSNGSAFRGLVEYDLTSIPRIATIVNATLRARVLQATGGETLDVHSVRLPWTEGDGGPFRFFRNVTVTETAGVARIREPIDLTVDVPTPFSTVVNADFRIYDATGQEVPSQVYGAVYSGPNVTRVHVVFAATMGPRESRQFTLYFGSRIPLVPSFRTKTLGNPLWTYAAGSNYASLTAVDLNNDGRLEVIVGSHDGSIYALQWNGSLLWRHAASDVVDYFSTVVDVDGDGALELVYATDGGVDTRIHAISTLDGTEEWNTNLYPTGATYAPIAIADVDGNGVRTLFVGASDRYLYAFYGNNGTLRWRYPLPGSAWGYAGVVADLTGDAAPEVLYTVGTGEFYLLTKDGAPAWPSPASPTPRTTQVTGSIADIDRDGALDIVAGDNGMNGNMFAFRGIDGQNIWVVGTGSDQFGGQIVVDFEDDGFYETAFAMTRRGALGLVRYNGFIPWTTALGDVTWAVPAAADIDLDGVEDILIPAGDPLGPAIPGLYVVNSNGDRIANFTTPDPVTATPIVADLDGDGTMEIVFSSRTTTYALSTGSLGHDFRTGGYNYNLTGRFLDGNSPDGVALLQAALGPVQSTGGTGVTWRTSDGSRLWASPGGDFDATVIDSAVVPAADTWVAWNVTSIVQAWVGNVAPNEGFLIRSRAETGLAILSSREGDPAFVAMLEIEYQENASPRIVSVVPNQVKPEDSPMWQLNLIGYAFDPDTPLSQTRWDLAGVDTGLYDVSGGNVTGNHILYFQPRPDAFGNNRVTLYLFDEGGRYASQVLWINITPVNDGPVFTPPATLYAKCGVPYAFDFAPYVTDVDTPLSAIRLRSDDPTQAIVSDFDLTVTFSYPASPCDVWAFVVLTVSDGEREAAQAIAVRLTFDAPPQRIRGLPDVVLIEGQVRQDVFDLDEYFVDPDADLLFYTEGFVNVNITIKGNHSVDFAALGDWYGVETGTFRAWDPTGAIAEDMINVTVLPVNDPPRIAAFPPFVVHYDAAYNFSLAPYVSDSDTPLSQILVRTSLPGYVTVEGMVLRMLFPRVYNGTPVPYTVDLDIYANDTIDEAYVRTFVTVGSDYPPRPSTDLEPVLFDEDTWLRDTVNLDDHFEDTDSSTIFYSSGQVNVVVVIKADHKVDFTAAENWYGFEFVTFRAMDDQGAYAEQTTQVTVRPLNDAPFFKALPIVESDGPNFFFNVRDYVDDVDNPNSTLTIGTSNGNVEINGFWLRFSYPANVREDVVNLTVTDPWGASSSVDLQVRIRGPNLLMALLPWILVIAAIAIAFFVVRLLRTVVEHVFLIYASGIPLVHLSRSVATDKDPDLVASMFTAIQSFMNESFHSMGVGDVKSIEMADHRVALARGESILLVVLYRGRAAGHIQNQANEAVRETEKRFGHVLRDWNGDMSRIDGVRQLLEKHYGFKIADLETRELESLEDVAGRV